MSGTEHQSSHPDHDPEDPYLDSTAAPEERHHSENNHPYQLDPVLDGPDKPGHKSDIDFEVDPLLRLERNMRSTKQAIIYGVSLPIVTCIVGFIIAWVSKTRGGPICDAGRSEWICSRTFEILFPVVPGAIATGGLVLAAMITYRRWQRYQRWRPWLAIIWFLLPFTMAWLTGFGTMAVVGQH